MERIESRIVDPKPLRLLRILQKVDVLKEGMLHHTEMGAPRLTSQPDTFWQTQTEEPDAGNSHVRFWQERRDKPGVYLIWLLVAALFIGMAQTAAAQCHLEEATPQNDRTMRKQIVERVLWPYLSPILKGEFGPPYTLIDPLHPERHGKIANGAELGVITPTRGLAIDPYQQGKLFAGSLGQSAPLTVIHEADHLMPILDAVDGTSGETWVVLDEHPRLLLYRIDKDKKIDTGRLIAYGRVKQARITRLGDGRMAVAYALFTGGRRYGVTSLLVAWFSPKGEPLGSPLRLDGVRGMQPVFDMALTTSQKGIVIAWNPITQMSHGKADVVPVELRAFHIDLGGMPRLTRRDSLAGLVWRIPEVGGILPNQLQAASAKGQAVLVWQQPSGHSMPLMAAPAEGGAPTVISADPTGSPLLRGDNGQLTIMFWDRERYHHSRARLFCSIQASGLPPAALDPPPADPSCKKPGPSDLDQAWRHVSALASGDSEAKRVFTELAPDEKADVEAKLTSDNGRRECTYDCVMAARTLDELQQCGLPYGL
jgi:hypothetical protein